jgi:PAS domain S-box-containing protein
MRKNKGRISLDKMNLTNPQKAAVTKILGAQKSKFKKLLHLAHERIHIIGDHTRNFEFWFNIMGHYEYVSVACERVTGYSRDEFMNGEVLLENIAHDDDKERFRKDKKGAFSGSIGKDVEYTFVTKQGEDRHVVVSWVPVTTRWGKLIGVRGSVADITEIKLYRNLVETLKVSDQKKLSGEDGTAVFSISPEGIVESWSVTAEKLLSFSAGDALGSDFRELMNDKGQIDALQGKIDRALRYGFVNYQAWLKHPTKKSVLGDLLLTKIIDEESNLLRLVCNVNIISESDQ